VIDSGSMPQSANLIHGGTDPGAGLVDRGFGLIFKVTLGRP